MDEKKKYVAKMENPVDETEKFVEKTQQFSDELLKSLTFQLANILIDTTNNSLHHFVKFILDLDSKNMYATFLSNFGAKCKLDDMFKALWHSKEFENVNMEILEKLKKVSENSEKSNEKAKQENDIGSQMFDKRDYKEALKKFNAGIRYAEQSLLITSESDLKNLEEIEQNVESQNLSKKFNNTEVAVGYANRALALLEMNISYLDCIFDCFRAIFYGYPFLDKHSIIVILMKAYICMNQEEKAQRILEKYVEKLGKKSTKKLVKKLKSVLKNFSKPEKEQHQILTKFMLPPTLEKTNPKLPSLSDAITLEYSEAKGRHLIANRDILPGEILIQEKAFRSVIFSKDLLNFCSNCTRKCENVNVPCPFCTEVVFCSEICLIKGYEKFHSYECKYTIVLLGLDDQHHIYLTFRLLIEIPLTSLRHKVEQYKKEIEEKEPKDLGFNENDRYDPNDYRAIYHYFYKPNESKESNEFMRITGMAVNLVRILEKVGYFFSDNKTKILKQDLWLVGETVLKHLFSYQGNIFTSLKSNDTYRVAPPAFYGAELYATNFVNHSCNPSTHPFPYENSVVYKSIRLLSKGEEITRSYDYAFFEKEITERGKQLLDDYNFTCDCEACLESWPTRDKLTPMTMFHCSSCSSEKGIGVFEAVCSACKKPVEELEPVPNKGKNHIKDLKSLINKVVKIHEELLKIAETEVKDQKTLDRYILLNKTFLTYLNKYSIIPSQTLIDYQDHYVSLSSSSFDQN